MQVIRLLDSVGRKLPTALTVSAGIRQQYRVAMPQEQLCIFGNAFTIIGNAMHQYDGTAVEAVRMHIPRSENNGISGSNAYVLQLRLKLLPDDCHRLSAMSDRPVLKP